MEIADHVITYQGDVPQHGIYAGEGNVIYFDSKDTRSILVENMDIFVSRKDALSAIIRSARMRGRKV